MVFNMTMKITKYYQIEQDIINAIKMGELKPGDKVDSESVIKQKYKVSTITVRKAFTDLINQGYLNGVQGLGTFVAKKQMIRGLTSISFSDELIEQGYKIDLDVDVIKEVVNPRYAEKLGIPEEQSMICVKRIRKANDEPVAYQSSYIDSGILTLAQAKDIFETKSYYKMLTKHKINPIWVNENYSVKEVGDIHIAKLMDIKSGTNTFFVKRTAFDVSDQIIEYAETYFNKDWYSVTVNIKT